MESELAADLDKMWPYDPARLIDTACLDKSALGELLVAGGYSLRPRGDDADPGDTVGGNPLMDGAAPPSELMEPGQPGRHGLR